MSIFDVLPDELFKPLASLNRRFYADLLLSLHEKTFSLSAEAPRRAEVIHEISDFTIRWEMTNGAADDEELKTSKEDRARTIYQRLRDTGWLIEHKDRYLKLVDLDPDASGLLHVLSSIKRGEARTYGGAVVGVLSALESAASKPSERSENIRNAIVISLDFLAHMRMVSVSLRKVEERIVRQNTIREIFKSFFEEFVQKHLISDYKTLHTRNNPFRFRMKIIEQCRAMSSSPLTVMALGEAYFREGRGPSPAMGQVEVLDDLAVIINVFENTESHLVAIDATAARIERRIVNTARYMDRVGRTSEASLLEAMKSVSGIDVPDFVEVHTGVIAHALPVGPPHIPTPRRERTSIEVGTVRNTPRDKKYARFLKAKEMYFKRTRVTPSGLISFVENALGSSKSIRGSLIKINNVDDFVAFQRMREIPTIFDGAVARKFEIEVIHDRIANDWINCQDFVVHRRNGGKSVRA